MNNSFSKSDATPNSIVTLGNIENIEDTYMNSAFSTTTKYGTLSIMSKAVLAALYTINKAAKSIRDDIIELSTIRNKIKALCYHGICQALTDKEQKILSEKYGIEETIICNSNTEYYDESYQTEVDIKSDYIYYGCRTIWDCIDVEKNIIFRDHLQNMLDEDEMEKIIDEDGYPIIQYDTKREDLMEIIGGEDFIDKIQEAQEFVRSVISDLEILSDNIQKKHAFVRDSRNDLDDLRTTKKQLYALKDIVIITSGIQPVAYHKGNNGEILAYYIMDGFKFHMPIDPLDVKDDDLAWLDETESIGIIDSKNRLNNQPTLEEALQTLMDCLGMKEITPDAYLKGKYNLADMMGIELYNPNHNSIEDYYCDYDNDDYDDYDDYEY